MDITRVTSNRLVSPEDWLIDFHLKDGTVKRVGVMPEATEPAALKSAHSFARSIHRVNMDDVSDIKINRRWQIDPYYSSSQK